MCCDHTIFALQRNIFAIQIYGFKAHNKFLLYGSYGNWCDNVYVVGASVNDFMFAYLLHASVILMAQVVVLLVVVFAIFEVSCYHSDICTQSLTD